MGSSDLGDQSASPAGGPTLKGPSLFQLHEDSPVESPSKGQVESPIENPKELPIEGYTKPRTKSATDATAESLPTEDRTEPTEDAEALKRQAELNAAALKIQSRVRTNAAQREYEAFIILHRNMREKLAESKTLIALPGTMQGSTGWCAHAFLMIPWLCFIP